MSMNRQLPSRFSGISVELNVTWGVLFNEIFINLHAYIKCTPGHRS